MMYQDNNAILAEAAKLPQDVTMRCCGIIHTAAAACGLAGAGFAQIPGSDSAIIVPFQIKMVIDLARVFGINLSESSAEVFVASAAATAAGRALSQWLLRWFPGVGNTLNALTAVGITEIMGWVAVMNFKERGGLF